MVNFFINVLRGDKCFSAHCINRCRGTGAGTLIGGTHAFVGGVEDSAGCFFDAELVPGIINVEAGSVPCWNLATVRLSLVPLRQCFSGL